MTEEQWLAARQLAVCPQLARLHYLDLRDNDLTDTGKAALANSPHRHPYLQLLL